MIFRCFIKIENQNRIAINANGRQQTMAECFSKAFNIQCQFKNKSNKIQTESFNLNANARKIPFTPACASFSRLFSFACRSLSLSLFSPPRSTVFLSLRRLFPLPPQLDTLIVIAIVYPIQRSPSMCVEYLRTCCNQGKGP